MEWCLPFRTTGIPQVVRRDDDDDDDDEDDEDVLRLGFRFRLERSRVNMRAERIGLLGKTFARMLLDINVLVPV